MKFDLKKLYPYLLAIIVFVGIACVYMSPAMEGKIIATSDGVQGRGACHESWDYLEAHGESAWWTGSMFSGMPTYQVGGNQYAKDFWLKPFKELMLWGHSSVLAIVIIYLITFFTLLRSMKIDKWICIAGAIAIAFSSYFFIIIGANHHGKTSTLSWMSVVIAGLCLVFNGHRKLGAVLTSFSAAIGFFPHPQMSYYCCFIVGALWVAELFRTVSAKSWKNFCLNTLIFGASFGIGLGTGTATTFANLEYTEQTMRGGHSDLEKGKDGENKTQGLDLDYATAWSYGIDECWTFIVPNYMGGSSNYPLGEDSQLCKDMVKMGVPKNQAKQFCESVPTYWGDQPFTAGPVYMGAIVCLLFLLGLLVVKGPYKWALLAVTLLSVFLSWGYHWMGLTRFFFDFVPMYNKFRAVSSILVIAEITMPVLGFMALHQLSIAKQEGKDFSKMILTSGGVLTALILVCLVSTSGFEGRSDSQMPEWLTPMLIDARKSLLSADCWRSLIFVLLGTAVLFFYSKSKKMGTPMLALSIGILVLADMWQVDKRYMNDGMFSPANSYEKQFKMQSWEKQILDNDKDPNFRVFNLAMNPFNDARTSYRLKSIGGYSAAKLRRYQDLIDQHLSKMHMPVINMLNTRYFITSGKEGGVQVQYNPDAMGNAWFVDNIQIVDTPNEECDGLMKYDLHHTAVVDKSFAEMAPTHLSVDSTAQVSLVSYEPNELVYEASCAQPGTVVFSEIYYPYGWKAFVDGKEVEHYRANYLLRALNLEPGKHQIRFYFHPESVDKGNTLSMIFVILMYLMLAYAIVSGILNLRHKKIN